MTLLPNGAPIDPALCPLCGAKNECAALSGAPSCWCQRVTIPEEVLARVPPEARGRACVCESCAKGGKFLPKRA